MNNGNTYGPTLGHFLEWEDWQQAVRLLKHQLTVKQKNRHFNTMSMFYYERDQQKSKEVEDRDYFETKIASNLFYLLDEEFAVYPYLIPKSGLGLRNYKFLSYSLRVLYYAVSIYLLRISQDWLREYYRRQSLRSYYGGFVSYGDSNDLILTRRNIYFLDYYKKFKRDMRAELTRGDVENRVILQLDVQNYYDSISVPKLLEWIYDFSKPQDRVEQSLDDTTREQIVDFFTYLMQGQQGIPQADNDIMSNFLGFLYLTKADVLLEDLCSEPHVKEVRIIRYLDDIAISLTLDENLPTSDRRRFVDKIASEVADILYYELALKLNSKTELYWFNNERDRERFRASLKRVSPQHAIADSDEDPHTLLSAIFRQVTQIGGSRLDPGFGAGIELEALKDVYDPRVQELLKAKSVRTQVDQSFEDFDFDLVRLSPLPLIILITSSEETEKRYVAYQLAKTKLTTNDVNQMLIYLCQTEFKHQQIIGMLRQYDPMAAIIRMIESSSVDGQPTNSVFSREQLKKLAQMSSVVEQIRLRAISERLGTYSVSLNHLLNEIHAVCFELDTQSSQVTIYGQTEVLSFLHNKVSLRYETKIRNLFSRRHINLVSHPNGIQSMGWAVSEQEYREYLVAAHDVMKKIL